MPNYPYKEKPRPKSEHKAQSFEQASAHQLGSAKAPLQLVVQTTQRQDELSQLCAQHGWVADISVQADGEENIRDLEYMQAKPVSVTVAKTPARNEPCHCGSGKKYKKCCA